MLLRLTPLCLLLVLSVALVNADVQPLNPPLTLCTAYTIEDDLGTSQNYAKNYVYVGGGFQFGPNLFIYNPGSALMSGTLVEGPYLQVADTSGIWIPGGEFTYNIRLYSDWARTVLVGTGTITNKPDSNPPTPLSINQDTDPNGGNNIITFVGGFLHVSTSMLPTSPGFGANLNKPEWVNYRNLNKWIYFQPQNSMPTAFPHPLMNRLMSNAETSLFGPPYAARLAEGLTNDKLRMIMWGSEGWNGQAYVNHVTGFDLLVRLTCDPTRNIDPIPPPPTSPCPDGNCVNSYMASYPGCQAPLSNPIVGVSRDSNCVSLVFSQNNNPSPCPRG